MGRADRLDALRGVAMIWMAAYHFAFDLNHFRLLQPLQNFYADPVWTTQRTCILSLFLLCAGAGQALAQHAGQTWPRFWRRWLQIAACAALVSLGSAWMFPRSWIFLGVLHGMALMLILTRLVLASGVRVGWLLALGALTMALPSLASHEFFNGVAWRWTGLGTRKPVTEDWVPLLPWWGVMLCGAAAARALLAQRPQMLRATPSLPGHAMAALGRHSLVFYMLHQPVLIGAIELYLLIFRR
jgi:uncharacterized membrane protein